MPADKVQPARPRSGMPWAVIIIVNGLISAVIGTLAVSLGGVWWSPYWRTLLRQAVHQPLAPTKITVASFVAGASCAVPLVLVLRRLPGAARHALLWRMAAGVAYSVGTAAMAAALSVPLIVWGHSRVLPAGVMGMVGAVGITLAGMFIMCCAMLPLCLILYTPFVLLGGALVGLLNGWAVRKLFPTPPQQVAETRHAL